MTGLITAVVALALPAVAVAWRAPTSAERAAITVAAEHSEKTVHQKLHVSAIRVSTAGPWASAKVTIHVGWPGATDILHKVRGTWKSASLGTLYEDCVMPLKDRRNLGFREACP